MKASNPLAASGGHRGLRHEGLCGVMKTFCVHLGTCNKELANCLLRSGLFKKLDLNQTHLKKKKKLLTNVKLNVW